MPLIRIRKRRTITLANLSFAEGEVTLIHPVDVAYPILLDLLHSHDDAWPNFLAFSNEQGVLDEDDFMFLLEASADEVAEIMSKIHENVNEEEFSLNATNALSPDQEADIEAFGELLRGMMTAQDNDDEPVDDSNDDSTN
ncbi:hypothetical protein ABZX73_06445 [Brevibacterium casei]